MHKTQRVLLTTNKGQVQLTDMKFPIEFCYVGAVPKWNQDSVNNTNYGEDWHLASTVTRQAIVAPQYRDETVTITPASVERQVIKQQRKSVLDVVAVTVQ